MVTIKLAAPGAQDSKAKKPAPARPAGSASASADAPPHEGGHPYNQPHKLTPARPERPKPDGVADPAGEAGWYLERERIRAGESMDYAASRARLPAQAIAAIEEGRVEEFIDDRQLFEALRRYATHLKFEPEPLVAHFHASRITTGKGFAGRLGRAAGVIRLPGVVMRLPKAMVAVCAAGLVAISVVAATLIGGMPADIGTDGNDAGESEQVIVTPRLSPEIAPLVPAARQSTANKTLPGTLPRNMAEKTPGTVPVKDREALEKLAGRVAPTPVRKPAKIARPAVVAENKPPFKPPLETGSTPAKETATPAPAETASAPVAKTVTPPPAAGEKAPDAEAAPVAESASETEVAAKPDAPPVPAVQIRDRALSGNEISADEPVARDEAAKLQSLIERTLAGPGQTASTPVPRDKPAPDENPGTELPAGVIYGDKTTDVRLVLRATQGVWVRVEDAQGHVLITRTLEPGDSYRVPNRQGLVIAARNAGALQYAVDGEVKGSLGQTGDIVIGLPLDPDKLARGG